MEVSQYWAVIRDGKWVIIQAAVVIVAAAMIISFFQKPVYEAQATVLIREQTLGTTLFEGLLPEFSSEPERSLRTQVGLIRLRPMAVAVVQKLDLDATPEEFLNKVTVEPKGQTDIIMIKVQDENPELARDGANTLAKEYVKWRREFVLKELRSARKKMFSKLENTEGKLIDLKGKITGQSPSTLTPEKLSLQLDIATLFYGTLVEKYEQLHVTEDVQKTGVELVAPAVLPSSPVTPKPVLNGIIALALGGAFGLGLVFALECLDNTIKTSEDAERYYELPVLAQIPVNEGLSKKKRDDAILEIGSAFTVGEAFRTLRTNIRYLNFDQSTNCIAVTSASPKEGKTSVMVNLGVALAAGGNEVILIDADLRHPHLRKIFGGNSHGLSHVLAEEISFGDALQRTSINNLRVLHGGAIPPNPSELLGSQKMEEVLEESKAVADVVLIDTPPALAVTDCAVLAPKIDGVAIVTKAGQSTRKSAKDIKTGLGNVGARLLGVVLNQVPVSDKYSYYYYYSQAGPRTRKKALAEGTCRWARSLMEKACCWAKKLAFLGFLVLILVVAVLYLVDEALGLSIFSTMAKYTLIPFRWILGRIEEIALSI